MHKLKESIKALKPYEIAVLSSLITIVLVVIIEVIVTFCTVSNNTVEAEPLATKISGVERNDAILRIKNARENMQNSNMLLYPQYSEDEYSLLVVNKQGQGFEQGVETSYTDDEGTVTTYYPFTIYRKDHTAVNSQLYGLYYGANCNELDIIYSAIDMVEQGNADILKDLNNQEGISKYYISIVGIENVKKMYNNIHPDLGNNMEVQLEYQIEQAGNKDNLKDLSLLLFIGIDNEANLIEVSACYIHFNNKNADKLAQEDLKSYWLYEGLQIIRDFEFLDTWESTDWSVIDTWDDSKIAEASGQFEKQLKIIDDIIFKFYSEHAEDFGLTEEDLAKHNQGGKEP